MTHSLYSSAYWVIIGSVNGFRFRLYLTQSLQWRHNRRDSVSNHQPHDCLLNRLFRRRSKETSKLRFTALCAGNSPVTSEFPAQMASNAEKCFHLMTSSWMTYCKCQCWLVFNWNLMNKLRWYQKYQNMIHSQNASWNVNLGHFKSPNVLKAITYVYRLFRESISKTVGLHKSWDLITVRTESVTDSRRTHPYYKVVSLTLRNRHSTMHMLPPM